MRMLFCALTTFAVPACVEPPETPVEAGIYEAHDNLLSSRQSIRTEIYNKSIADVAISLIIDRDGKVVSASLFGNVDVEERLANYLNYQKAIRLARSWKFKPFVRNGRPVPVQTYLHVDILPAEDIPERIVQLPSLDRSFKIALERTGCYGSCPQYSVEVDGSGNVTYYGGIYTLVQGKQKSTIPYSLVEKLYRQTQAANFLALRDEYRYNITDNPTYAITVSFGKQRKTVVDYVGRRVGMPNSVEVLEDMIDELANTDQWINGDSSTIDRLSDSGFDFKSANATRMLSQATADNNIPVVRRLVSKGTPWTTAENVDNYPVTYPALKASAFAGNAEIVALLLDSTNVISASDITEAWKAAMQRGCFECQKNLWKTGKVTPPKGRELVDIVRGAAESGDVRIVRKALSFDPPINYVEEEFPRNSILGAAASADCEFSKVKQHCDPYQVVKLLIQRGADPTIDNPAFGSSPMQLVGDPRIAKLLIDNGADPNFKDFDGEPVILSIYNEDAALVLLENGLDVPKINSSSDKQLKKKARRWKWNRFLVTLSNHQREKMIQARLLSRND